MVGFPHKLCLAVLPLRGGVKFSFPGIRVLWLLWPTENDGGDSMWLLGLDHQKDRDSGSVLSSSQCPPLEPSHELCGSPGPRYWQCQLKFLPRASTTARCGWACLQRIPALASDSATLVWRGAETHSQCRVLPKLQTHEQNKGYHVATVT